VVALADLARFEFARELECCLGDPAIAPALRAVSAMIDIRAIAATLLETVKVFDERMTFHEGNYDAPDVAN